MTTGWRSALSPVSIISSLPDTVIGESIDGQLVANASESDGSNSSTKLIEQHAQPPASSVVFVLHSLDDLLLLRGGTERLH